DWQAVATELGFRPFVALPLETTHRAHGTVTVYFASAKSVGVGSHHLLRAVADQMAGTAEKARLLAAPRRSHAGLPASDTKPEKPYTETLEARRVKDEFLWNVSHELRTPLASVIGYISLMQEGLAGPVTNEQRETLGEVKDASEHLLALVNDLLDLTALKR